MVRTSIRDGVPGCSLHLLLANTYFWSYFKQNFSIYFSYIHYGFNAHSKRFSFHNFQARFQGAKVRLRVLGTGYKNSKLLSEAYLRREPRDTENATLTQLRQPRPPCLHATLPPCPCMACTIYVMQICTTFTTHRAHAHARAHAAHAPMRPRRVLSS